MSSENNTTSELPKESRRIALHTKTTLRFTHFEGFVTEYSSNLSMTGMFIRSDNPQEAGTVFDFEFKVADGLKLIHGKAEVVWARYEQLSADRPPGMGVRFVDLDNESKRLIRWIVERHVYEGGKPFELEDLRSVVDETLAEVEDDIGPEPQAPAPAPVDAPTLPPSDYVEPSFAQAAKESSGTVAARWLGITAAVLGVLWLGFAGVPWLMQRIEGASANRSAEANAAAERRQADSANAANESSVTRTADNADGAASADATSEVEVGASDSTLATSEASTSEVDTAAIVGSANWDELTTTVGAWADAWSSQDTSRYLSYYGSRFVPPRGMKRSAWEQNRRERLGAPSFISVSISNLEIEATGAEEARATFTQSYRSNTFSDVVTKTLDLMWENEGWKIATETSG